MFFFCNRSSNNSAIRPLRLKFPLALNSSPTCGRGRGKAAAPGRGIWLQHRREQLLQPWETRPEQQTVCTERPQGLCWLRTQGRVPQTPRAEGAIPSCCPRRQTAKSVLETTDIGLREGGAGGSSEHGRMDSCAAALGRASLGRQSGHEDGTWLRGAPQFPVPSQEGFPRQ